MPLALKYWPFDWYNYFLCWSTQDLSKLVLPCSEPEFQSTKQVTRKVWEPETEKELYFTSDVTTQTLRMNDEKY